MKPIVETWSNLNVKHVAQLFSSYYKLVGDLSSFLIVASIGGAGAIINQ